MRAPQAKGCEWFTASFDIIRHGVDVYCQRRYFAGVRIGNDLFTALGKTVATLWQTFLQTPAWLCHDAEVVRFRRRNLLRPWHRTTHRTCRRYLVGLFSFHWSPDSWVTAPPAVRTSGHPQQIVFENHSFLSLLVLKFISQE